MLLNHLTVEKNYYSGFWDSSLQALIYSTFNANNLTQITKSTIAKIHHLLLDTPMPHTYCSNWIKRTVVSHPFPPFIPYIKIQN